MEKCYLGCGKCFCGCPYFKEGKTDTSSFAECTKHTEPKEPTIDDYKNTPTSDLFAMVCEECQVETVLAVAEGYVATTDAEMREFLFACLGFNIE